MMIFSSGTNSHKCRHWIRGFYVATAYVSTLATANAFEPTTTLGSVDGLTDQQQRIGDAVQMVCGGFATRPEDEDRFDTTRDDLVQQQQLFVACGQMVNTANVLSGVAPGEAGTARDLGINEQQLAAALQNVAAEEVAAAGSLATESVSGQSNVVGRRLAGILSRASTLQVSGANLMRNNSVILANLPTDPSSVQIGGAASADDPELVNPIGFYVNGMGATTTKTTTDREDGFESDSGGISVGADYLFGDGFLAGINVAYSTSATKFNLTEDVSGGNMDSTQTNVSAYGMWFNDAGYLDLVASFGSGTYDMERRIFIATTEDAAAAGNEGANDTVFADTDSTAGRFSIGGGMEFRSGAISFAPYGRLSYLGVSMDGYQERGDSVLKLNVNSQDIESLTTGFGFRLVGTYSGSKVIVSPQFNVEMIHEFLDDSRQIVSTYVHDPRSIPLTVVTDQPDRTYYTMGVGLSAVLTNGVQLYGQVRSLLDLDDLNEFSTTAGVRFAF